MGTHSSVSGKQTGGTHIGGNRLCGNSQWKQTVETNSRNRQWQTVSGKQTGGTQIVEAGCVKPQEVPQWPLLGSVKMLFWDQHGRGVSARGSFATPHRRTALQDFPANPLVLECQGCQ